MKKTRQKEFTIYPINKMQFAVYLINEDKPASMILARTQMLIRAKWDHDPDKEKSSLSKRRGQRIGIR